MKKLKVNLDDRSYPILIKRELLSEFGSILKGFNYSPRCMIVTNSTVNDLYGEKVKESLAVCGFKPVTFEVEDSERAKSLNVVEDIYKAALSSGLDRRSPFFALGGGVVGDVTGFAAATYMRGLPFIQIPTTLLAQVDSSVGGKVAVNFEVKNLIGSFYQPNIVFIDPVTLDSLPAREFKAGMAEVIKYGVIWDSELFSFLEANCRQILNLDPQPLEYIIKRSCEIKAEIVAKDEYEKDLRMLLNLGHTFGHVVEITSEFKYKHGEAVGLGICLAAQMAQKIGVLPGSSAERMIRLVKSFGLPVTLPDRIEPKLLMRIMQSDKKARADIINLILPKEIGRAAKYSFTTEELLPLLKEVC